MKLEEGNVIWLRLPFDRNYNNISNTRHPYIIIKRTDTYLHLLQGDSYTEKKEKRDLEQNKNKTIQPFVDILPIQPGLLDKPGYVQMDNIITIDNFENEKILINNKSIIKSTQKLDKTKLEHLKRNYTVKINIKIRTGTFDPNRKYHIPLTKLIELEKEQQKKETPVIATSYPYERKNRNKNHKKGKARK